MIFLGFSMIWLLLLANCNGIHEACASAALLDSPDLSWNPLFLGVDSEKEKRQDFKNLVEANVLLRIPLILTEGYCYAHYMLSIPHDNKNSWMDDRFTEADSVLTVVLQSKTLLRRWNSLISSASAMQVFKCLELYRLQDARSRAILSSFFFACSTSCISIAWHVPSF